MQCTPEQIELKRQIALQKLAQKQNTSLESPKISSKQPLNFAAAKPYDKPRKLTNYLSNTGSKTFTTGFCALVSEERFHIVLSGYCQAVIDIYKTIPSKKYNVASKSWDFHLKDHDLLLTKLKCLKPIVEIEELPQFVINCVNTSFCENDHAIDLETIDSELYNSLMPFQFDGVLFGIKHNGRCLIADDMGLGKTFQALAIAHYYIKDWPLLIVTTSTMKNVWEETIHKYLPSVPLMQIQHMVTGRDCISGARILIVSHDLMARYCDKLIEMNYGVIIIDESHLLKNSKAKCTQAATGLAKIAKRVILLSGTPALSRPSELYSQLYLIDNKFFGNFFTYSKRYCDGQQTTFGWWANGKSNLQELEVILNKKFMIRRTKHDVLKSLPNKVQEVVNLDVNLEEFNEEDRNCLKALSTKYVNQKNGKDKHALLLNYFQETCKIKIPSVCSYILQMLKSKEKFIVFAHHQKMLNEICKILNCKNVKYIRIDGNTSSENRKQYIDKFQFNDNYLVAVLSITAANAGITLTSSKLVIFAELHWNPSILSQAESRAHRIGQSDTVLVRYLIAKNTADESIWKLLQNKQKILGEIGLSKDSFENIHSTKQTVSKNERLTNDIPQDPLHRSNMDITKYFQPVHNNSTNSENSGLFDDGFDEIMADINF